MVPKQYQKKKPIMPSLEELIDYLRDEGVRCTGRVPINLDDGKKVFALGFTKVEKDKSKMDDNIGTVIYLELNPEDGSPQAIYSAHTSSTMFNLGSFNERYPAEPYVLTLLNILTELYNMQELYENPLKALPRIITNLMVDFFPTEELKKQYKEILTSCQTGKLTEEEAKECAHIILLEEIPMYMLRTHKAVERLSCKPGKSVPKEDLADDPIVQLCLGTLPALEVWLKENIKNEDVTVWLNKYTEIKEKMLPLLKDSKPDIVEFGCNKSIHLGFVKPHDDNSKEEYKSLATTAVAISKTFKQNIYDALGFCLIAMDGNVTSFSTFDDIWSYVVFSMPHTGSLCCFKPMEREILGEEDTELNQEEAKQMQLRKNVYKLLFVKKSQKYMTIANVNGVLAMIKKNKDEEEDKTCMDSSAIQLLRKIGWEKHFNMLNKCDVMPDIEKKFTQEFIDQVNALNIDMAYKFIQQAEIALAISTKRKRQ